ncbi:MAG: hypothetical protein JNK72_10545 [Myxococcales bacterium]|nr:hypothetical protein [Myxococcales bacterium]
MELRTQLMVLGLVAVAWAGGRWVRVRPVLDAAREAERMSLGALEAKLAQHPTDVVVTRVLLRRYLDHGMPRLVVDTAHRAPGRVQQDGAVSLCQARAEEALGNVETAYGLTNAALGRCATVPEELADGAGCDVRTQTELAFENAALERMREWHISPVTDPRRASLAHELASRPVRISARVTN